LTTFCCDSNSDFVIPSSSANNAYATAKRIWNNSTSKSESNPAHKRACLTKLQDGIVTTTPTATTTDLKAIRHEEVERAAAEMLAKGKTPAEVRRLFSQYGVRWEYQFKGQGRRERIKRLRKQGRTLCRCGLESYDGNDPEGLGPACLEKKWSAS